MIDLRLYQIYFLHLQYDFPYNSCFVSTFFLWEIGFSDTASTARFGLVCFGPTKAGAFAYGGLRRQTPNVLSRSGCPTNPVHDRLAETEFRYRLNEDPLDVQLVHLS